MEQAISINGKSRIGSIDLVRGIVMIIMALDHVRDYFHVGANLDDPLNLATTTPALFFTRWITHLCAPVFVFLSGTSIYLQSLRKTKKELGIFLIKRGLWLIFAEIFIISFGWTFNPQFNVMPFQVIWAIGISMFILGLLLLLRFTYPLLLATGLLIVLGHNLLYILESSPNFLPGFWWDLLHHGHFTPYEIIPGHFIMIIYPFLAWLGLMLLGYCVGKIFEPTFLPTRRVRLLTIWGAGLVLFFIVLRFSNLYGDPVPWSPQKSFLYSFLSFMKVEKYPPSLLFLSITIGISMLFMAALENVRNRFTKAMMVFGRTAFFYYILHIYLIHLIATVLFFARGHTLAEALDPNGFFPFLFIVPGEGLGLPLVYFIWIGVVFVLYPLCKKYDRYKLAHREKWWLGYL